MCLTHARATLKKVLAGLAEVGECTGRQTRSWSWLERRRAASTRRWLCVGSRDGDVEVRATGFVRVLEPQIQSSDSGDLGYGVGSVVMNKIGGAVSFGWCWRHLGLVRRVANIALHENAYCNLHFHCHQYDPIT
jgi:hypothetical protein